jgi:hypothetical protein
MTVVDEVATQNSGPPDSPPQTHGLVGTKEEPGLFPLDAFDVERSEAVLGAVTVPVHGQFEQGDEVMLLVPAKCVNVTIESRERRRRHTFYATEMHVQHEGE